MLKQIMKKKILFLTAFTPNDAGAAEKNTKLMLQDLSKDFDVDLIYFKYKNEQKYIPPNTKIRVLYEYKNSFLVKVINILLCPFFYPTFTVRFNIFILRCLRKLVNEIEYDSIIFDHSQMFLYAKTLNVDCPKVMLAHDIITQRVGRTSNRLVTKFCKKTEEYCLKVKKSYIFSFSQKDCDIIHNLYGLNANLCLDYIDSKILNVEPQFIENTYVFIGKWSRADNLDGIVWFYNNVVPLIGKPIIINIIGKNFPTNKLICNNPLVTTNILGFVENPYSFIANSKAMLAPLFTGAGIKVKVVESIACGTPVIGTEIAFEGLPKKYSKMMLLANDAGSYIKAMETSVSIEERKKYKQDFISDYISETIPQFLNKLLQ